MVRTVGELVRDLIPAELNVCFDFALPEGFVHDAGGCSGADPRGHFVWLYDSRAKIWGRPYPLDHVGMDILHCYNVAQSQHYPEDFFLG